MPDVTSNARTATSPITFVALDVHKSSITAAVLAADGGAPEVHKLESDERAIRRFLRRTGEPEHLAVCYEAGPCGYEPYRLISGLGVACDIVAPSLTPQRPGERVKTDRRDALKLVRLYRAGELGFVCPPTPAQEGLRDLLRCRDDLRCARTAARHRVSKQLLRHGRIYREGRRAWTGRYHAWLRRQRLEEPLAQLALEEMIAHLEVLDAQLAALDRRLCEIAASEPWREAAGVLACFRGIGPLTALSLLGEIGDFHRFASPRELMSFLGLTVSEHSSGQRCRRGGLTKTGNRHARRLLIEAAWQYQHRPCVRRRPIDLPAPPGARSRAWQAQLRLSARYHHLLRAGKLPCVAIAAVARELCGFLWAAMTEQPQRETGDLPARARKVKAA